MTLRTLTDRSELRAGADTFDARNQKVRSRIDNETIGTVEDVLIDDQGVARYLSVDMEGEDRRVLLPVGEAEADREANVVWVTGLSRSSFRDFPQYDRSPASINEDYEKRLHTAYETAYAGDRYHDRPDYRSRGWGRGTGSAESGRLERLDKVSDVDVASGEPDPRGWKVVGRNGLEIGKVDHLIGDTGAMKVRYLVTKVDKGVLDDGRDVLIPVGHVDLDTDAKRVVVDALDATMLQALPAYSGGPISREDEQKISSAYSNAYTGANRYRHPRYRDESLYGR